jgi:acetyltransferase-like isoleucine patch superfamily enzyme
MINRKYWIPLICRISFLMSILLFAGFLTPTKDLNVGKWCYGSFDILFPDGESDRFPPGVKPVNIGSFCSIASETCFMVCGDHRGDWVSTFPFPAFASFGWFDSTNIREFNTTKGPIVVGNDVWIGKGALILSGVNIGDGAIIGAHAVVSKDVPPYGIAVGNPARVVKYRFDPDIVQKLLTIAWWSWEDYEIQEAIHLICSNNIHEFIDYCKIKNKF